VSSPVEEGVLELLLLSILGFSVKRRGERRKVSELALDEVSLQVRHGNGEGVEEEP